jgi:hypothetical protein
MNHFQIGLTQQTLSNFITVLCNNYVHEEADVLILDEDGVRIVGNVIAHLGPPNRVKLEEPNKLSVEHLTLLFERFQVVITVDIPHSSIDLPFPIPDVSVFGDNPDMRWTIALDEYIYPEFSLAVEFLSEEHQEAYNIYFQLLRDRFQIYSFNIPGDLGRRMEEALWNEVRKIIPGKVDDIVLRCLGDLTRVLGLPIDISGWIVQKIVDSEWLRNMVEDSITRSFIRQHLYSIPLHYAIGDEPYKREIRITEIPITVQNGELTITAHLSEVEV